jgi:hypothetical protein
LGTDCQLNLLRWSVKTVEHVVRPMWAFLERYLYTQGAGDSLLLRHSSMSLNAAVCLAALQVDGRLLLRVWCPCTPTPYPDAPPLLALSCGALPGSSLLALTARLAGSAQALAGSPMVHELAVQLAEELEAAAAAGASRNSQGQLLLPAPPPFDQPLRSSRSSGSDADGDVDDGYTTEAQQHAAAAEAIMGDDSSSNSSGSSRQGRQQRRRPQQQMSAEQQAAESRRLAEHFKQLQVSMRCAACMPARLLLARGGSG